ncbi:hypothetical protein TorRG33x02_051120 [Trema orientale]|uniref:Uncharacterized protein n=1 Tax=Trema orientale TaxID=63057 RepID=A0A2P5FM48_TREOI|nr:hypothetical protein TorRG33x02_051120 [Trema orientale]
MYSMRMAISPEGFSKISWQRTTWGESVRRRMLISRMSWRREAGSVGTPWMSLRAYVSEVSLWRTLYTVLPFPRPRTWSFARSAAENDLLFLSARLSFRGSPTTAIGGEQRRKGLGFDWIFFFFWVVGGF